MHLVSRKLTLNTLKHKKRENEYEETVPVEKSLSSQKKVNTKKPDSSSYAIKSHIHIHKLYCLDTLYYFWFGLQLL